MNLYLDLTSACSHIANVAHNEMPHLSPYHQLRLLNKLGDLLRMRALVFNERRFSERVNVRT